MTSTFRTGSSKSSARPVRPAVPPSLPPALPPALREAHLSLTRSSAGSRLSCSSMLPIQSHRMTSTLRTGSSNSSARPVSTVILLLRPLAAITFRAISAAPGDASMAYTCFAPACRPGKDNEHTALVTISPRSQCVHGGHRPGEGKAGRTTLVICWRVLLLNLTGRSTVVHLQLLDTQHMLLLLLLLLLLLRAFIHIPTKCCHFKLHNSSVRRNTSNRPYACLLPWQLPWRVYPSRSRRPAPLHLSAGEQLPPVRGPMLPGMLNLAAPAGAHQGSPSSCSRQHKQQAMSAHEVASRMAEPKSQQGRSRMHHDNAGSVCGEGGRSESVLKHGHTV